MQGKNNTAMLEPRPPTPGFCLHSQVLHPNELYHLSVSLQLPNEKTTLPFQCNPLPQGDLREYSLSFWYRFGPIRGQKLTFLGGGRRSDSQSWLSYCLKWLFWRIQEETIAICSMEECVYACCLVIGHLLFPYSLINFYFWTAPLMLSLSEQFVTYNKITP